MWAKWPLMYPLSFWETYPPHTYPKNPYGKNKRKGGSDFILVGILLSSVWVEGGLFLINCFIQFSPTTPNQVHRNHCRDEKMFGGRLQGEQLNWALVSALVFQSRAFLQFLKSVSGKGIQVRVNKDRWKTVMNFCYPLTNPYSQNRFLWIRLLRYILYKTWKNGTLISLKLNVINNNRTEEKQLIGFQRKDREPLGN